MERRHFLKGVSLAALGLPLTGFTPLLPASSDLVTRKIFVTGGEYDLATIKYLISLTGKAQPRICYLPTPVGDSEVYITRWHKVAAALSLEPIVQKVFVTSTEQQTGFEDTLLSVDAILVTGGNTLNTIALWKAHGLDTILRKAWEKGIVLSGPSAGAICWFEQGLSDSRPKELSVVEGLGFLEGSNCPHYHSEKNRRDVYQQLIASKKLKPGYACDDKAGLYFEGTKLKQVITQDAGSKAYRVELAHGQLKETALEPAVQL
jgi:peptidase E